MDELVAVIDFLNNGDLIALGSGNMVGLYRVRNDVVRGEASLEFEGLGVLTGSYHIVRKLAPQDSASVPKTSTGE